jgi:High potential iron-sulfur protein
MRRMSRPLALARRQLLERLAIGLSLAPVAGSALRSALASPPTPGTLTFAADTPLLAIDAPEAKAVKYVEDARTAPGATPGSDCASCGLYQGAQGSAQGPCQLFPGRSVKASGWCSAWTPQL